MQKLKTKIKMLLSLMLLLGVFLTPQIAMAADCQTSATPNGPNGPKPATPQEVQKCLKNNKIIQDLNTLVNFLSAGVGIVVTGVIILGGIQYIMAGDNTSALTAARQRIINGLIALVTFIFIYTFLQWLIPGGAFG